MIKQSADTNGAGVGARDAREAGRRLAVDRTALSVAHPTSVAFLDESGSIARDRFFAVGCLKVDEPALLTRKIQNLRDRRHWYGEIHFVELTRGALPFYKEIVDVLADLSQLRFSCFVADRSVADPIERFGDQYAAYQRLAVQLLHGNVRPHEIVAVLADNYSTPPHVRFEESIKAEVNRRLRRLAVHSVVRLDSRAADPLQLADLLVSAITFEFRASAGRASTGSPKGELARYVRSAFGADSCLQGVTNGRLNVKIYRGTLNASRR
jgi:hypothetical protein